VKQIIQSSMVTPHQESVFITGNDVAAISQLKKDLFNHFQTKDLRCLKYFLSIEVAQSNEGIIISQSTLWIF